MSISFLVPLARSCVVIRTSCGLFSSQRRASIGRLFAPPPPSSSVFTVFLKVANFVSFPFHRFFFSFFSVPLFFFQVLCPQDFRRAIFTISFVFTVVFIVIFFAAVVPKNLSANGNINNKIEEQACVKVDRGPLIAFHQNEKQGRV